MIETHIPAVNVDELMERIREEVRRRKAVDSGLTDPTSQCCEGTKATGFSKPGSLHIESLHGSPAFIPKTDGYHINDFLQYHDREFVRNAYLGILCREADSGGYNHYLEKLQQGTRTKVEILGRLRYADEGRRNSVKVRGLLLPFLVHSSFNIPILGYLIRLITGLVQLPTIIKNVQLLDTHTQNQFFELKDYLDRIKGSVHSKFDEMIRYQSSFEDLRASKADRAELESVAAQAVKQEAISAIDSNLTEIRRQIRDHKLNILDQERRITMLLEGARKRLPEPLSAEQTQQNMLSEEDHLLDAMYVSFEDQFRGTREDIKGRQSIYLPFIEQAEAGTREALVLDIGCGRGEWLELLKENDYVGIGVDLNRVMVQQCLELGFDVVEADLIQFLRHQNSNSFGAVTGFHIVEHLPLKALVSLIDESLRVLKPGGVVIFETPNPENLLVGASLFYADPTHGHPLFPDTLRFLVEYRGFVGIRTLKLHRRGEPVYTNQEFVDEIIWRANMEQDYSVIGFKA
jgi:SAM-dependent methyltransferase